MRKNFFMIYHKKCGIFLHSFHFLVLVINVVI